MPESTRAIAKRRGYLSISVRERGKTPRGMKKAFNAASKQAWADTAEHFHDHMRDARFTPEHGREAGYAARKGELQPRGTKAFKRSYYGRKLNSKRGGGIGEANPLESTGETRRNVATQYRISSTSKGARIRYIGARKLNFRHPKSRIRMTDEFRRLLDSERIQLASVYDSALDRYLAAETN